MRPAVLFTTALLLCVTLAACTIRKQDEIECGLPDGSSFILRAKYDWSPFARFIPHAAERLNRTGFVSYYKGKGKKNEMGTEGGSLSYTIKYDDINVAKRLCSMYGLINKVPYITLSSYKEPSSSKFTKTKQNKEASSKNLQIRQNTTCKLLIHKECIFVECGFSRCPELFFDPRHGGNQPPHILETLEKLNANIGAGAYIWRSDRLVLENRIVSRESPYINLAVYRIESFDDGQTWSNPHITTEPEAFELGKTYEEQCFVARLIRIDKQKIEAHFPPCPISEALPD